jgi:hypothetical protein
MHSICATILSENKYYMMHMTIESQQIKLDKHMLSLSKSDSPIWEIRSSGFVSKTIKTGTSSL